MLNQPISSFYSISVFRKNISGVATTAFRLKIYQTYIPKDIRGRENVCQLSPHEWCARNLCFLALAFRSRILLSKTNYFQFQPHLKENNVLFYYFPKLKGSFLEYNPIDLPLLLNLCAFIAVVSLFLHTLSYRSMSKRKGTFIDSQC